ncbi:pickpocket protein 28 [Helicoverpa armigera]|uniref:pickpocket protein 28 n=1 Tax=Helicoverpa armigera TaxID=29058 RepID=UPI00308356CF
MYTAEYSIYREEPGVITRFVSGLWKAVLRCGKAFCEETSMHGFYHIAAPQRHMIERILWVAATALAIWGALDVSLGQLQRYNDSPTVVTLEKDFRSWRFNVPAVTMCYKNRVDPTKLPAAIKKHFDTTPSDDNYDYYTRLVEAVANSDLFHLEAFEEFSGLETSLDMFQIAVDVMHDCDVKMRSSDEAVYKWIPVMTESGVCYSTNSVALADVAITKVNPNDSMSWPETCKYSSLSCYIIMDVPSTAYFYVHSPYDVMDLTHKPSEVILTLVRNTELSVTETRCGRGVEELQPSRRGCLYTDEPAVNGRKVHSTNTCRLACRSKLAKEYCGCVPFYYFYEEGPPCTPKGLWCLASFKQKLSNNNGEKCACSPQCIDCIYKEISTADQIWDRHPFNQHGSVKFTVQAPRTRYTREIVFHFQDLVVSFGGAAGLFLGASFISFVEILYFLLTRLFRTIARREERKVVKTTAVKVKKPAISHETVRMNQLTAILDAQKTCDGRPGYYY